MKKRAAIELSVNFLVILIISITLFSFGVAFVYNIFNNSQSIKKWTMDDIDRRLAELSCGGDEKVCLQEDTLQLAGRTPAFLEVNVLNIMDDGDSKGKQFKVNITPSIFIDTSNTEVPGKVFNIDTVPPEFVKTIKPNSNEQYGFGFQLPTGGETKGQYIYNLDVYYKINTDVWQKYDNTHKFKIVIN